jgi:hypothetical protein
MMNQTGKGQLYMDRLEDGSTMRVSTNAGAAYIVILADDLRYGDVGCSGSPDVPTPNIDSIAAKGARFTDGHVTACICSPSHRPARWRPRRGRPWQQWPGIEERPAC